MFINTPQGWAGLRDIHPKEGARGGGERQRSVAPSSPPPAYPGAFLAAYGEKPLP